MPEAPGPRSLRVEIHRHHVDARAGRKWGPKNGALLSAREGTAVYSTSDASASDAEKEKDVSSSKNDSTEVMIVVSRQ